MLIYSQDKKCIYNLENMTSIYIEKYYENCEVCGYSVDIVLGRDDGRLGKYETEERTIEILGEIIYHFKQQCYDIVYEMPEK